MSARTLEVHRHSYLGTPSYQNGWLREIVHSHEGPKAHQHEDFGPATYTICKKAWLAATGLRGGGVKKFTAAPTGPQLPLVDLEEWQKSFRIIVGPRPENHTGEGGGFATAVRMVQQFDMKVES